ncbi:MAG: efflux RND transporter periplasmic adaptor subunit [Acidiferrobacteraceae bacterium]
MRLTSRPLLVATIVALGTAGAYRLLTSRSIHPGTDAPPTPRITVQVGTLRRMTMHGYVTGYGRVDAAPATPWAPAAAAAIAAPVTGVVTAVLVAPGEHVRSGQLLMELNSGSTTEAYAAQEVARLRRLYAEHNASLKALQNAEAQLALLRVTAPLSGTVVGINVKPGAAVDASTVLAKVIDLDRLVVRTSIPEMDAGELKTGEVLHVLGASPLTTTLAYVSPTINSSNGTVMAWASLPHHSGLRPGQFVRLRIVTATARDALVAPSESVIRNAVGGRGFLSVVRGHEAIRVPVKTGLREGGWVEVSGPGLAPGTRVVTVGAYGLPTRTAIQIQSATARPSAAVPSAAPGPR